MVDYPASLPLDAVMLLTDIVRSRKIGERKVEAAKAAWNVQGFAMKSFIGDTLVGDTEESLQFAVELGNLAAALDAFEDEGVQFGAADEQEAESVSVVIAIVGIVIQLIQLIKNRKKDEVGCDGDDCDCDDDGITAVG